MTDDVAEDLKRHLFRYLSREIDEKVYCYVTQDVYEKAALDRQAESAYSRVANALFADFENFVVLCRMATFPCQITLQALPTGKAVAIA